MQKRMIVCGVESIEGGPMLIPFALVELTGEVRDQNHVPVTVLDKIIHEDRDYCIYNHDDYGDYVLGDQSRFMPDWGQWERIKELDGEGEIVGYRAEVPD